MPKRTVSWIGLNPSLSGFRRSVVVHDRVPDGRHIDTLTQPRHPPVSMPSHFILRQDAERADPDLVGGEPGFVLDQPSRHSPSWHSSHGRHKHRSVEVQSSTFATTTDPATDQSTYRGDAHLNRSRYRCTGEK
jgi:hypothetical protein